MIAAGLLALRGSSTTRSAARSLDAVLDKPERLSWLLEEAGDDDEVVRSVAEVARAARRTLEAPRVFLTVGLVAGALMREKTLDGFEVEALVREARRRG